MLACLNSVLRTAQAKDVDRGLRRNGREIDRELRKMQQLEKQTMVEVKKLAAAGQTGPAKMMAKNIVQLRKQQEKMYKGKAQLSGVAMANKVSRYLCEFNACSLAVQ